MKTMKSALAAFLLFAALLAAAGPASADDTWIVQLAVDTPARTGYTYGPCNFGTAPGCLDGLDASDIQLSGG